MLDDIGSKPVSEIMQKDVHVISPEKIIQDAVRLITKYKVNRLPVVEDDILVGIITRGDIIHGLGGAQNNESYRWWYLCCKRC
jgi:CBS domain-containing protein